MLMVWYALCQQLEWIRARAMDLTEGILFMEPLELFRSKCACFVNLPQDGRQDEKHLNILRLVIPHYFRWLLESLEAADQRLVLGQVKKFRRFKRVAEVRRALAQLGWDLDDLVPVEDLRLRRLRLSCDMEVSLTSGGATLGSQL